MEELDESEKSEESEKLEESEDLKEIENRAPRLQISCKRCGTKNWYTNINKNLLCPFCVEIERINLHFRELRDSEDNLRFKSGFVEKKILKRKEMYIASLDELISEVDAMSDEEKSVMLRELGFDKF